MKSYEIETLWRDAVDAYRAWVKDVDEHGADAETTKASAIDAVRKLDGAMLCLLPP